MGALPAADQAAIKELVAEHMDVFRKGKVAGRQGLKHNQCPYTPPGCIDARVWEMGRVEGVKEGKEAHEAERRGFEARKLSAAERVMARLGEVEA